MRTDNNQDMFVHKILNLLKIAPQVCDLKLSYPGSRLVSIWSQSIYYNFVSPYKTLNHKFDNQLNQLFIFFSDTPFVRSDSGLF